ncbi:hypothetical protein [Winogradskyella sp. 3972H.M.0a.05]|uniref:hypothetical protein n=1 Tax=Winogradskyella sp. 3972H.M.0a.05 TaxID=2950277 RepID=UPI0033966EC9
MAHVLDHPNISHAHEWLRMLKAQTNISYNKLGSYISYSGVGFKKALDNERLTLDQIKVIAAGLGYYAAFISDIKKIDEIYIRQLALDVNENLERLLEVEVFQEIIDTLATEKLYEISRDKESLIRFFNKGF